MNNEQILQRALEVYPEESSYDSDRNIYLNENDDKREGYIKALKEIEQLPKTSGWVARDDAWHYGSSSGWLRLHFRKPIRNLHEWYSKNEFDVDDSQILKDDMFPDLTWESEPLEVELILRKL